MLFVWAIFVSDPVGDSFLAYAQCHGQLGKGTNERLLEHKTIECREKYII